MTVEYALSVGGNLGGDPRFFEANSSIFGHGPPAVVPATMRGAALVRRHGDIAGRQYIASCQDGQGGWAIYFEQTLLLPKEIVVEVRCANGLATVRRELPPLAASKWTHIVWSVLFDGTPRTLNSISVWINGSLYVFGNNFGLGDYVAPALSARFEVGASENGTVGDYGLDIAGLAYSEGTTVALGVPGNDDVEAMWESVRQGGALFYNSGVPDTTITFDTAWSMLGRPGFAPNDTWSPTHGTQALAYMGFSNADKRTDSAVAWL